MNNDQKTQAVLSHICHMDGMGHLLTPLSNFIDGTEYIYEEEVQWGDVVLALHFHFEEVGGYINDRFYIDEVCIGMDEFLYLKHYVTEDGESLLDESVRIDLRKSPESNMLTNPTLTDWLATLLGVSEIV